MADVYRTFYGITDSFEGGMNSGLPPHVIMPNQTSFSINVTHRDGFPRTRPPFKEIVLGAANFQSGSEQTWFENENVQEAVVYDPFNGPPVIVVSIGGRIFLVRVERGFEVEEITPTNDANSAVLDQAWMRQAEEFLIIQDGQSKPIIYDGAAARRSEFQEVPTGKQMAYGNGRLWVAVNNRQLVAGDIFGGPTGILKFTENEFIAEGGRFNLRYQTGAITAMEFMAALDTSLGDGDLAVHTREGVVLISVPTDRLTWKDLQYPVQRIGATGFGSISQTSLVNVNSDQWYRAKDGYRSFLIARRDFGTWGNTPQTKEVERILKYDSDHLLRFCSAVVFDNRLIWTVNPVQAEFYAYHRGFAVLDFSPVSTMRQKLPPAYDGLWHIGVKPIKIFTGEFNGKERCFVFCRNLTTNKNELWELLKTGYADVENDVNRRIPCAVESRSYTMADERQLKRLQYGEVFVDEVVGEVDFDLKFRADQYPCWRDWHAWSECAKLENCPNDGTCIELKNLKPQYRPRMRTPDAPDECDSVSGMLYRDGYQFQTRVAWTGYARLKSIGLWARELDQQEYGECRADGVCVEQSCCEGDPFSY